MLVRSPRIVYVIQYWRRVSTGCFRERNRGPLIRQYGNTAGSGGDELLATVVEGLLDVRDGQRAHPVRIARQPGVERLAMFLVRPLDAAHRHGMLAPIAIGSAACWGRSGK